MRHGQAQSWMLSSTPDAFVQGGVIDNAGTGLESNQRMVDAAHNTHHAQRTSVHPRSQCCHHEEVSGAANRVCCQRLHDRCISSPALVEKHLKLSNASLSSVITRCNNMRMFDFGEQQHMQLHCSFSPPPQNLPLTRRMYSIPDTNTIF